MKLKTFTVVFLPLILVLSILFLLLLSRILDKPFFTLTALGIVKEEKIRASDPLLTEIRELGALHTVEYVHKTVFPFDFLDEGINFDSILRTLRTGKGTVRSLLSPAEQEYLETRNLAAKLGLSTAKGSSDFVVITVIVRGGIDLSGTTLEVREVRDPSSGRVSGKAARLLLSGPEILDLVIEDPRPENYPYPDIKLNPAAWRELAMFVEDRVREKILTGGMLRTALENGKNFLSTLLRQSGFSEIEISQAPDR